MVNSTRKSGTPRNSHNMVKENDYKGEEREREREFWDIMKAYKIGTTG